MKHCVTLALLLLTSSAFAAPLTTNKERFVTLELQAMDAPSPALKYQILPELSEMQPGNCIPVYLKCFCEQQNFFFNKESSAERERLLTCPLSDIKKGSLKGYGGSATRNADSAARMEICDWNLLPKIREDGYNLLLPDLQQLRMLASAIVVRCRGELVDGDFDGAVKSIKTLFGLGRHTGEHPCLIGSLVGMAISQLACNCLEEMIQQPGAPNMYWALASAPTPFIDMRRAMGGERMFIEASFGTLVDGKRPWGPDDIAEATKKFTELKQNVVELPADKQDAFSAWLQERLKDAEWLAVSRKMLIGTGYPEDKVKNYPPEQVVFYRLMVKARVFRDETLKWMMLPYWQAEAGLETATKKPEGLEDLFCHSLGFAGAKVRLAHTRLEQRLAGYRIIEAIRLHGATNGGKLPAKLDDISVPLPVDPATGKAFDYKVDGMTALLAGKATKTGETTYQYRYELRLRK